VQEKNTFFYIIHNTLKTPINNLNIFNAILIVFNRLLNANLRSFNKKLYFFNSLHNKTEHTCLFTLFNNKIVHYFTEEIYAYTKLYTADCYRRFLNNFINYIYLYNLNIKNICMNDFCVNEDNATDCIFSFNLVFDFIFVQLCLNTNLSCGTNKCQPNAKYDVGNVDIMLLCRAIYMLGQINNKYDYANKQTNHENSLIGIDDLKDDYRYKNFTCLVSFLDTFIKPVNAKYLNAKKIKQILRSIPDYTV
jgi:hypothetical protein